MRAGSTIRLARRLRRRGSGSAGAAAVPLARETGRAAGPFAALSLRSERLLGAGSLRRLANAVPARNPSTIAVRTSGPHLPTAQKGLPTSESCCLQPDRRPAPAGRGLTPYKASSNRRSRRATPQRVGAATAVSPSCPTGACSKEVSPFGRAPSRTTSQPGLIATRTLPQISRFARRLEGRRLIRTAFQGHPAVCMYDVAGAAVRPQGRRRLKLGGTG